MEQKQNIVQRGVSWLNTKLNPAPVSRKSFGYSPLSGGGFYDLNTAYKYADLPPTPYGIATAVTASVEAFACIHVRMSKVGSMPWEIKRKADGIVVSKSTDSTPRHVLAEALLDARKTMHMSLFSAWEYWLCIHGEMFVEKTRSPNMMPAGLYGLDPLYVTINAPLNIIQSYRYNGIGGSVEFKRWEVAYHKYPHPYDPVHGLSPLETALNWVNIDRALSTEVLSYFRRGMRPSAFISPKEGRWEEDDALFLEEYLSNKVAGSANAHKPMIAPRDASITPFDYPEFKDQDAMSDRVKVKVHKAFRISPAMTGDADSSRYQANNTEDEWLFDNVIKPECDGMAEVVNLELLPFLDPSNEYEFAFDYSDYAFVTETEKARAELTRADYEAGIISLNAAREARGEKPIDLTTGVELRPGQSAEDFYFVDGVGLVPQSEVANIWKYKLIVAPSVYNSEAITGEPLPQPTDPTQVIPTEGGGAEQLDPTAAPQAPDIAPAVDPTKDVGEPLFMALDLSNDPALIELQKRLFQMYPNPAVKWSAPSDYHITLLYAPAVDPAKRDAFIEMVQEYDLPAMALKVGSLHTFDNVGEHALHFQIRRNVDLLNFQAALYDLCQELGISTSPYSVPVDYKPHITMAYLPDKVSATTFHSKLTVRPQRYVVKSEDAELYRSDQEDDPPPDDTPDEPDTAAIDELKAWHKKTLNKGAAKALEFQCQHIDGATAQLIRSELTDSEPTAVKALFAKWQRVLEARAGLLVITPDNIPLETCTYDDVLRELDADPALSVKAIYAHAHRVIGMKALATTQAKFEAALVTQFTNAFNEKIRKTVFISRMLVMLTRYSRLAVVDGYADGGSEIDLEADDDEETIAANAWLDAFISDQEQYVRNIADVLYADDEITLDEIRGQKPQLWWTGSVLPAYNWALMTASRNARLKWVLDPSKENCESCKALNGIVLTAKRWKSEGVEPGSRKLECWGGNCGCQFVPTKEKKYRGALPKWQKSIEMHQHEHAEVTV